MQGGLQRGVKLNNKIRTNSSVKLSGLMVCYDAVHVAFLNQKLVICIEGIYVNIAILYVNANILMRYEVFTNTSIANIMKFK